MRSLDARGGEGYGSGGGGSGGRIIVNLGDAAQITRADAAAIMGGANDEVSMQACLNGAAGTLYDVRRGELHVVNGKNDSPRKTPLHALNSENTRAITAKSNARIAPILDSETNSTSLQVLQFVLETARLVGPIYNVTEL